MRATAKRKLEDQVIRRDSESLPDGIGGTITGGPMEPIDLTAILSRPDRAISRGGAVSGAAQTTFSRAGTGRGRDEGIALSDGSRISFASIDDAGHRTDAHFRVLMNV
jgi:hypothetical protein